MPRVAAAVALLATVVGGGAWLAPRLRPHEPARFSRLTFSRGTVTRARFSADGRRVFYSAAWGGQPNHIFSMELGSPSSSRVSMPDAMLLAVSSRQELAVLLDAAPSSMGWSNVGTLAVVPAAGGAPRPVLEGVLDADWAPDGGSLAVVCLKDGRPRIEWPPGNVIYEPGASYITTLRCAPGGDRVAFAEHPRPSDDRGRVVIVDKAGKVRVLSGSFNSVRGLAWTPDGQEVWFAAASGGSERSVHAVRLDGRDRVVLRVMGTVTLQDLSRDGRSLVLRATEGLSVRFRELASPLDMDLGVWDAPLCTDISGNGDEVLITETGEGSGDQASVFLRGTDGSAPVRLGDGLAYALSSDRRWVLAYLTRPRPHLVRIPTGAGAARALDPGTIEDYAWGRLTPDGRSVVFDGNEPGRERRLYVQAVDGGPARPITPEGVKDINYVSSEPISPDGREVVVLEDDSTCAIYPLAGGTPRPVHGIRPGDLPVAFGADSRTLYVVRERGPVEYQIDKLDPETGQRALWHAIRLTDPAGIDGLASMRIARDGLHCAFTVRQSLSDLYLAEGLQ